MRRFFVIISEEYIDMKKILIGLLGVLALWACNSNTRNGESPVTPSSLKCTCAQFTSADNKSSGKERTDLKRGTRYAADTELCLIENTDCGDVLKAFRPTATEVEKCRSELKGCKGVAENLTGAAYATAKLAQWGIKKTYAQMTNRSGARVVIFNNKYRVDLPVTDRMTLENITVTTPDGNIFIYDKDNYKRISAENIF